MSDDTAPTPDSGVKPGVTTSEFWMQTAAHLLSVAFLCGIIPTTGTVERVAAAIAFELGALGYGVIRTVAKGGAGAAAANQLLAALGPIVTSVLSRVAASHTSPATPGPTSAPMPTPAPSPSSPTPPIPPTLVVVAPAPVPPAPPQGA